MADEGLDEQIGTEFDIFPDTDSFLPRYLTRQLLELLTVAIGKPRSIAANIAELAQKNMKFIASFKSQDLFTPLTYSIFWREDVDQTLEKNIPLVDQTDKYNRAPLTLAIANEDFGLAVQLIQNGATLLLEDKLVLEIALISMIQRDPNVITQILSAKQETDKIWVQEYLDYLNSYVAGEPQPPTLKYHEVLNPPLRHFGQILDTLAYFNGLPSHYGFLSPSIEILTTHLQIYIEDLNDPSTKALFTTISAAYDTTHEACKFFANLPTVTDAANTLAAKIASNIKSKSKDVVVLFGGWAGNSISIAFVRDTLIFSNLGMGGNPEAGTKIFNIDHPEAITAVMVDSFIRGLGNATSPIEILALLGSIVDQNPIHSIKQAFNPIDNCIFVNPRAIVQGILLVLSAYNKDNKVDYGNLSAMSTSVADMFKNYVNSLYKYSTADLAKFMRNNELIQNRRIECCALAIDYINQHFKEPGALPRCIELKNALEYVGLEDFYTASIDPEAQTAIQQLIIHEQEATAIQVIEQENNISKQG